MFPLNKSGEQIVGGRRPPEKMVRGRSPPVSTLDYTPVCSLWRKSSGAQSCPRCFGYIHIICGRSEGEEGYGSSVVCPACDISSGKDACYKMRAGIKRCQEKQQDRMLNTASKKFKEAVVGDSVLIPNSQPDKVYSLGPRITLGCITSRDESTYSIGTTL